MANRKIDKILLKKSGVIGNVPTILDLGELAINYADVKLYASGTTSNTILPIGWDRISRTGDTVNGNYIINGSLSATTYLGLPKDIYVTGGTYSSGTTTFTNNTGGTFSITGFTIADEYVKINSPILKGSLAKIESVNVDINSTPLTANTFGVNIKNNVIIGKNNQSNANNNLGFGDNNQFNSGGNDVIIGSNNQVNQSNTLIFGKFIQSNAGDDFLVGANLQSNLANSFTIGYNPVLSTGFDFRVSRTNGIELGQFTGLGTKPIGVDNNGKVIVLTGGTTTVSKEIVFKINGNVPQFQLSTTESNTLTYKPYKIKKIIVLFKEFELDIIKTIPIGIYEVDTNFIGNNPNSNLIYTANCNEPIFNFYSNKTFIFDVDITLTANKLIQVYTLGFTAGTQNLKDCIITLIIEEL